MAKDNSFKINLQVMFDKVKSLANINKDIKAIGAKLSKILLWRLKIDNAYCVPDEYLVSYNYGDN